MGYMLKTCTQPHKPSTQFLQLGWEVILTFFIQHVPNPLALWLDHHASELIITYMDSHSVAHQDVVAHKWKQQCITQLSMKAINTQWHGTTMFIHTSFNLKLDVMDAFNVSNISLHSVHEHPHNIIPVF